MNDGRTEPDHSGVHPPTSTELDCAAFWHELAQGRFTSGRYLRLARDVRPVWLQATYNPVAGEDGRIEKIARFATDVTAQVEREIVMREQIDALDHADAVVRFETDGTIIAANDLFLDVMGYAAREVVGRHNSMFLRVGEADDPGYAAFWNDRREGVFESGEFPRRGDGGRLVWLRGLYSPIHHASGRLVGVFKFAADITEEVARRERAELPSLVKEETQIRSSSRTRRAASNT